MGRSVQDIGYGSQGDARHPRNFFHVRHLFQAHFSRRVAIRNLSAVYRQFESILISKSGKKAKSAY